MTTTASTAAAATTTTPPLPPPPLPPPPPPPPPMMVVAIVIYIILQLQETKLNPTPLGFNKFNKKIIMQSWQESRFFLKLWRKLKKMEIF
jgi:hypothetical protein